LKDELQRQYLCFCETKRKKHIQSCDDPIQQLKILKEESLNCSTNQGNKKGHDKKTVERQPKKLYRGARKQSKEHHP